MMNGTGSITTGHRLRFVYNRVVVTVPEDLMIDVEVR